MSAYSSCFKPLLLNSGLHILHKNDTENMIFCIDASQKNLRFSKQSHQPGGCQWESRFGFALKERTVKKDRCRKRCKAFSIRRCDRKRRKFVALPTWQATKIDNEYGSWSPVGVAMLVRYVEIPSSLLIDSIDRNRPTAPAGWWKAPPCWSMEFCSDYPCGS